MILYAGYAPISGISLILLCQLITNLSAESKGLNQRFCFISFTSFPIVRGGISLQHAYTGPEPIFGLSASAWARALAGRPGIGMCG